MRFLLAGFAVLSLTTSAFAEPQTTSAFVQSDFLRAALRTLPPNMTPVASAKTQIAACKSDGETCSGPNDKSCCSGLSCHSGGTGQGYICF
jgi:hypothetical protein